MVLIAMTIVMIAGSVLAIFPIGPVAALLAWPLYRAGVRARSAYAAVGAISALAAPLLFAVIEKANPEIVRLSDLLMFPVDSPTMVVIGWFALIGAFSGVMAARALRRGST